MEDHGETVNGETQQILLSAEPLKKDTGSIKEKLQNLLSFLVLCVIVLAAGMVLGYSFKKDSVSIKHYPAGRYSASLTERNELLFLSRNTGETILVDSALTEVISQKMASQEYLKTNKVVSAKQ